MTLSQATFSAALLDAQQPTPIGLSDGHGGGADKRFNVYRNNVAVSLTEALETAFPVLRTLVGDAFFKAMVGIALRQNPPKNAIMAQFGQDMPGFLETFPPVAHLPYLPDIARLENAVRRAYHAADVQAFTTSDLSALSSDDFGDVVFTLAPAVSLIRSAYPTGTIWKNNQPSASHTPAQNAEDILISRPGFDPIVDVLPTGAFEVLSTFDGQTALTTALESAPEGFDFSTTLRLALERGCLINIAKETP